MAQGPASCTLKPASKKPGSRTWHNRPVDRRWQPPSTWSQNHGPFGLIEPEQHSSRMSSPRSMRWTMRWPLTMRRWSPSTRRWRASCRPATRGNLPPSCTRSFQRHQWRNWSSTGRWWDQPTRLSSLHSSHGCAITTSENFASLVECGGWPMDGSIHPSGPSSWNGRSW